MSISLAAERHRAARAREVRTPVGTFGLEPYVRVVHGRPSLALSRSAVLALQSAVGNRGVAQVLAGRVQARSRTVRRGDDEHEQAADRFADEVVPLLSPGPRPGSGSGEPIEPQHRSVLEPRLGVSLGEVRTHTDDRAQGLNDTLQSRALTVGTDVFFATGEHAPHSRAGLHLLTHELAHVAQQSRGEIRPQPVLRVRNTTISPDRLQAVIDAVTEADPPNHNKTIRKGAIYQATLAKHLMGRRADLLAVLHAWAGDEVDTADRQFRTWDEAMLAAVKHLHGSDAVKDLSPEELVERTRLFAAMSTIGVGKRLVRDEELATDERDNLRGSLPQLRRTASFATDLLGPGSSIGIERRKKHKLTGDTELETATVRYRTYSGTIGPKANAFVTGTLAGDYGPLLAELVTAIRIETAGAVNERAVAGLFLTEFDGTDAFAGFSAPTQALAHKVITIMYYAEMSRHSVALVSAAAAFYAVQQGLATMAEAFDTAHDELRALFAGEGGANLLRGLQPRLKRSDGSSVPMSPEVLKIREERGALDIRNLHANRRLEGESLDDFVRRSTLLYTSNLSRGTDRPSIDLSALVGSLIPLLHQVKLATGTNTALTTLTALGVVHHPMDGDDNECALNTIWDQLTRIHGLDLGGNIAEFRDFVRARAGFTFGAMIDILNNGAALLHAVQLYLISKGVTAHGMVIDVWSATAQGHLMEFRDVAATPGAARLVLNFYFDGVNHFDSLSGGILR